MTEFNRQVLAPGRDDDEAEPDVSVANDPQVDAARAESNIDELPAPPPRHTQDVLSVEGEDALHPPKGHELIQHSKVQG